MLADTSDLTASGNPGIGYEKLNLRDRSTLFTPDRFSSPERTLLKNYIHLNSGQASSTFFGRRGLHYLWRENRFGTKFAGLRSPNCS